MAQQNINSGIRAFSNGAFMLALILLVIEMKIIDMVSECSVAELWLSLKYLSPFLFAFLLSIGIILITWSNHRSILLMIDKSSLRFKYANGFLLLTTVFIPFSTAFLAEYGLTNLAGPAMALYSFVNFMQAIARTAMMRSALYPTILAKNSGATQIIRETSKKSSYTIFIYGVCTILAFWFPLPIAMVIALTWVVWLFFGLSFKEKI